MLPTNKWIIVTVMVLGILTILQYLSFLNPTILRFLHKTGWTVTNPNLDELSSIWILYGIIVLITVVVIWLINKKEN